MLPFNIMVLVAQSDGKAWRKLQQADREFYEFSVTTYGIGLRDARFAMVKVSCRGNLIEHTLFGKLHRKKLPAVIYADGTKIWYKYGVIHRGGGMPAYVVQGHAEIWYQYGNVHRDGDQPAIIHANGYKVWFKNGQCHRVGGPAVVYPGWVEEWHYKGKKVDRRWM